MAAKTGNELECYLWKCDKELEIPIVNLVFEHGELEETVPSDCNNDR